MPHSERVYIHPNYDPSAEENKAGKQGTFVASDWRDHSVPLSVAHSYHRVCPTCADEVMAQEQEQALQERRRRGTEMWRVFAQNPTREGEESLEDEDGDRDDFMTGQGGDSGPVRPSTGAVGTQHWRAAVANLSEQTFNDRRGAAARIARDLGIQLLSSETIDQWEHRLSSELRMRGAELVASDGNGRPMRLGEDGWEAVPSQGPIRDAIPRPQPAWPRSRNRARPAAQSAETQIIGANPARMVRQQGRLGPRTMARQVQSERRRNPPMQLTTIEEAERRARFQQATINERRRIEEALAARNLPMLSEEEVQRRLQPIRDLMSAPPILASIQSSVRANEAAGNGLLRSRESELRILEAEETERLRMENRQRRNAVTMDNMVQTQLLNAAAPVERGTANSNNAMDANGEEADPSESDEVSLPELEDMHEESSTTLSISTSAPPRNQTSESPSPEEHCPPPGPGVTAHQQRVRDNSRLHLPEASLCYQHSNVGWEMHTDRPSHMEPDDNTTKIFATGLHMATPRAYEKTIENLVSDTCEVLVYYDGCNHVEAVFIERLYHPRDRDTARCGCDAFGDRLLHRRKALSRQKCIDCRTGDANQKHPEQLYWLEKYIRPIETERGYRLWPFGSKGNSGVMDHR